MNTYENEMIEIDELNETISNTSKVHTKLTTEIKIWFKQMNNNHTSRLEMIRDFRAGDYKYWHNIFRMYAHKILKNIPLKSHKPTDFLTICLFTMNDKQINSIDENLINFKLEEFVENIGEDYYNEGGTRCACGKEIHDIVIFKNKYTDIEFIVGIDCAEKNGMINKDKLKEIKKTIKLKKENIKKDIKMKLENKICSECGKYTIPKTNIDDDICKNCITYKHYCYKCGSQYENKFKNPSSKLCNICNEENVKRIRKIQYENNLWSEKYVNNLSDFDIGDIIDIDGIRFTKNKYDQDYNMRIKTYDSDKIINANFKLKEWINEKYPNINKNDYINNTFKLDINIEIINKYLNKYDKYTVVLKITEVIAEYE